MGGEKMASDNIDLELGKVLKKFCFNERDICSILEKLGGKWKKKILLDFSKKVKNRNKNEIEKMIDLIDSSTEKYVLSIIGELAPVYDRVECITEILSNLKTEDERLDYLAKLILYSSVFPKNEWPKIFYYSAIYVRQLNEKD